MPHQCLNCGHIIARGSKEILKGCSKCSGKKFMYVDKPLEREQREDLKRKADKVRDEMLRKADPEFLDVLQKRGMGNIGSSKVEMDDSLGDDWIRVRPGTEEEVELSEGMQKTEIEVVPPPRDRKSARDLISEFDRSIEDKMKVPDQEPGSEKKPSKRKKKKKGSRKVRSAMDMVEPVSVHDGVDVINIVEQGVYEIDVQRLLEDNPIVIQKDGSYLIHLPSVFKEGREKRQKKI